MSYSNASLGRKLSYSGVKSNFSHNGGQYIKESEIALRKPLHTFRFLFLALDIIALNGINFFLIVFLGRVSSTVPYLMVLFATNLFWLIAAYSTALYFGCERFFKRTVQTCALYFSFTLFFIFFYKYSYSRLFVMLSFILFGTIVFISRFAFILSWRFIEKELIVAKKFIVLGAGDLSERLVAALANEKEYKMDGYFDDRCSGQFLDSSYYRGRLHNSVHYALQNNVSEIYSIITPGDNEVINEIAQQAEKNLIRFRIIPNFDFFTNRRLHLSFVQDIPILSFREEPLQNIHNRIKKRMFDIVFSLFIIFFLLSWLIPLIAALIKLDSKGPVFFKQMRSGKNNIPFMCFKFRSLKVNDLCDKQQVTRNDGRFTGIGKFLRKTNIDELPQFFNVLQGYMSVVGPRPHMLAHTQKYAEAMNLYMVRHFVKPGVTGWAQINGYRGEIRKEEQLHKRIECDISYMENWSVWLDLKITFLTIYKIFVPDQNAV
jgi:putative colanic acid biosysnthesis UDP-glucose lipid carrier transferase